MDSDYLSPPPAYSEQEFDQKISRATDLSIVTPSPKIDEEGWELYDPAAFDNVSAVPSNPVPTMVKNPSSFSSSSHYKGTSPDRYPVTQPENDKSSLDKLPTIVPLRIEKKPQSKYDHLYNADAGPSSPLPQPGYDEPSYEPSNTTPITLLLNEFYDPQVATHEQESAPGSHSASPPSFEGRSSFAASTSNVESTPQENLQVDIQQNMHYDPCYQGSRSASTSSFEGRSSLVASISNIESDSQDNWQADTQRNMPYEPYYQTSQSYSPRQSLPVESPRHQVLLQERPASSYSPRPDTVYTPSGPQVQFNPSVAYGKHTQPTPTMLRPPASLKVNAQYDPHSFYNSAVSAQMDPIPMRSSQVEAYSAPSYNQSLHSRPVQQPQFYSHDFPPRNLQQFANTPRQSVWQAPSPRPNTNYTISNTPRNAAADSMNRFSQYPNSSARDSMYSTNQNEWYSPR